MNKLWQQRGEQDRMEEQLLYLSTYLTLAVNIMYVALEVLEKCFMFRVRVISHVYRSTGE